MWNTQTPKYDGPDQPAPCETQHDSLVRWVLMVIGALFPSTPHYEPSASAGSGDGSPSQTPTGNGSVDPKQAALGHLLRALFTPSK
jgi:hypothetical protein